VQFFAIDSDSNEPDGTSSTSKQATWLKNQLAASSAPWKLVYMHHPPYSSGAKHGSTPRMQWPYQSWGASAVLAGHDHEYERIVINGFPYFVDGLGGAGIYAFNTPIAGSEVRYNADNGALLVDATDTDITFQFFSVKGVSVDLFQLSNGGTGGAPVISAVASSGITQTAASITWTTDIPADSQVEYGKTISYGNNTAIDPTLVTSHSRGLSGLTASTLYHYRVKSRSGAGVLATRFDNTFTTASAGTATKPVAPSDLVATAISSSQIDLVWRDNSSNEDGFKIERSTNGTTFTQIATVGTGVKSYSNTGLAANTWYYYRVRAYNAAGNSAYSNTAREKTKLHSAQGTAGRPALDRSLQDSINLERRFVQASDETMANAIE
jgi:hypothetical protein